MTNPAPSHASSASANSPFPRARLIFGSEKEGMDFGHVFVHISGGVRCLIESSAPQHVDDFAASDVEIELMRSTESSDESDSEEASADEVWSSEALADSVRDVVGLRPEYRNCVLTITGNVIVRTRGQAGGTQQQASRAAKGGAIWLIAESREERDVWLLLLRARLAPTSLWHGVCRTCGPKGGAQLQARMVSFFQARSTQASQSEMVGVLLSERSRWAQDNPSAPDQSSPPYGEGSANDVSDATLLLHASVMQVMELSTRIGATASKSEFEAWREGAAVLRSIRDCGKVVCTAVYAVTSAVIAGDREASMDSVLDALIGCWECLLAVEGTLLKISSTSNISDDVKALLHEDERTVREFVSKASVAQLAVTPQPTSTQDGEYQASFRVDIPCSGAAAKEGSPQYEAILDELLNTDVTDDFQPVAVTSVSGEGGGGKTTTCVLALRDSRMKRQYKDGVFGFEIGPDAQESDMIKKISDIVDDCHGTAIAQSIRDVTEVREAAKLARRFFTNRCILLYLDNVWPDTRGLEDLMSVASGRGSCVLFSTRSTTLAEDYTDRVVELGILRLDVAKEKAAAECIFYRHLGPQRQHRWCTAANVNEALALSQGLPIAIATLAALIRNMLGHRLTTDVLGKVSANLCSPPRSSSRNLKHKGLFAAMTESLEFLDRQHTTVGDGDDGSRGLMTRRYASLHALDRSEDRIDKSILSILWNTDVDDAEVTAGKLFDFGLVRLATPRAVTSEEDNDSYGSDTLTLHDLQVEYSGHVVDSGRHGITVEEVHETAVRGMFEGSVDIDALGADDFARRCEELCENDQRSESSVGRYVVSNLLRHLIGSLCPHNMSRRWPTIQRLLLDARWLMLWQGVDGWSYLCNRYTALRDALSGKGCVLDVVPDAEVDAIVEVGRVAQTVPVASRSLHNEVKVKTAAVEMYSRLHATWRAGIEGISPTVLQRALQSLCVVAGQWWMRPMVACHRPRFRDQRLHRTFAASRSPVYGCALIGSNGHVVTGSEDGVVRVHDGVGAVVAQHHKHSDYVTGVCVGRSRGDTEYRVFSVSDDRTLMRWDVSLPTATGGLATAVEPVVVASTETSLFAVACSDDASVVAAGCEDGTVYILAFGGDESQSADASKLEAREHTESVNCVAMSSDGATVLSGSWDGTCRVWAVADALRGGASLCSRAVLGGRSQQRDDVLSCAFAREERVAVTGHWDGMVRFWSLADATLPGEVDLQSGGVWSLAAIGRAGDEIVAGTARGTAYVVRVSDRAVTAQLGREDGDRVESVSGSCDDTRTVVCGHKSGQVKVWDARRSSDSGATDAGTRTRPQRPRHSDRVYTVSTSRCGRFVVSGSDDETVRCWRADTGRELWTRDCGSRVWCVCVSADAANVACGCRDGTVLVLEMANGEVVCEWNHDEEVYSVCMHELGDDLVWSGHLYGDVVAWSRGTNTPALRVQGLHKGYVRALGVAAGGKCVYSEDDNGRTARIEVSDDGDAIATTWLDRGNTFAEHTAEGFRTGGQWHTHSRVRHAHGGRVHEITATTAGYSCILDIDLRLPNRPEVAILTPAFEYGIQAVDASFVADTDGVCSFAQVACGLWDGSVCILRQPLAEDAQHWHPAEALQ